MLTLDLNKPVQTRNGDPVRILCTDASGDYPVVGLVQDNLDPQVWTQTGEYYLGQTDSLMDLMNIPEPVTRRFCNVYADGAIMRHSSLLAARRGRIDEEGGTIECIFDGKILIEVRHHG